MCRSKQIIDTQCRSEMRGNKKIYIFSYGSLMLKSEIERTLKRDVYEQDLCCAKLHGYRRSWDAIRHNQDIASTRVAISHNNHAPKYVTYSNIKLVDSKENGDVVGICFPVQINELEKLDRREIGYRRVNVTNHISMTDGSDIGEKILIYTYIDDKPKPDLELPAVLCKGYLNTLYHAASSRGISMPSLKENYLLMTPMPDAQVEPQCVYYFDLEYKILHEMNECRKVKMIGAFPRGNHYLSRKEKQITYPLTPLEHDVIQAWDHDTDSSKLFELSKSDNQCVRYGVLQNRNTSHSVAQRVVRDSTDDETIALSPWASQLNIDELLRHSNWAVRFNLARNPMVSNEALKFLHKDTSFLVRWAVACNAKSPNSILRCLAKDDDRWVSHGAKQQLTTSLEASC